MMKLLKTKITRIKSVNIFFYNAIQYSLQMREFFRFEFMFTLEQKVPKKIELGLSYQDFSPNRISEGLNRFIIESLGSTSVSPVVIFGRFI